MLIILCAVFGIFFGLISDYSEKISVILSCAFGGAYLIVKGVGMLIKNYPDEFSLAERIKLHQFDDGLPVFYYVYLGIIVVLGISGSIIQFRLAKDMPSEVKERDDSSYDDAYISIDQNDLSIDVPSRKSFKSTYRYTPSRARLN